MFAALANYVVGPQSILETMFEKDDGSLSRKDEDFQRPTKDVPTFGSGRSITTPVPAVTCSANLASINRPTAYS